MQLYIFVAHGGHSDVNGQIASKYLKLQFKVM